MTDQGETPAGGASCTPGDQAGKQRNQPDVEVQNFEQQAPRKSPNHDVQSQSGELPDEPSAPQRHPRNASASSNDDAPTSAQHLSSGSGSTRLADHRNRRTPDWGRIGAYAGIFGVFVAVVGVLVAVIQTRVSVEADKPNVSALRVAKVSVGEARAIDADFLGKIEKQGMEATFIDVILRNDGDLPAVITKIDLIVESVTNLSRCASATIGGMMFTALYDFRIPGGDALPDRPFTISKDVRFKVAPHDADRLTISLGPENNSPSLQVVSLKFRQDAGSAVSAGRAAVTSPAWAVSSALEDVSEWRSSPEARVERADCARKLKSRVEASTSGLSVAAPSLDLLKDGLARYSTPLETGAKTVHGSSRTDWGTAGNWLPNCSESNRTNLQGRTIKYGDFVSTAEPEAFVEFKCSKMKSREQTEVWVFDGASPKNAPRWLGCVLNCWVRGNPPADLRLARLDIEPGLITVLASGYSEKANRRYGPDRMMQSSYEMDSVGLRPLGEPFVWPI